MKRDVYAMERRAKEDSQKEVRGQVEKRCPILSPALRLGHGGGSTETPDNTVNDQDRLEASSSKGNIITVSPSHGITLH